MKPFQKPVTDVPNPEEMDDAREKEKVTVVDVASRDSTTLSSCSPTVGWTGMQEVLVLTRSSALLEESLPLANYQKMNEWKSRPATFIRVRQEYPRRVFTN